MAPKLKAAAGPGLDRLRVVIRGAVQGVGFRPFVFRLANELQLNGWVKNSNQGVFVEVEGTRASLETFLFRLESEKPPRSFIQSLEAAWLDPAGFAGFEIRPSEAGGEKTALVLPDIATCPECRKDIFDPANRRYYYPFTNCTHCGPRFSIIERLPYDRATTSMRSFVMCAECQAEYENPRDRRFHAQPNACPVCGPRLALWDNKGRSIADRKSLQRELIATAAAAIRKGGILAVKSLGGFHLVVSALDDRAVRRLRERKHREEKPFALMFPSMELLQVYNDCSLLEERLLRSPEAPIVLLRRREEPGLGTAELSSAVAPGNPFLGAMLPYTPLHHLLLAELGCPVVATSGNRSDEPICTDERDAIERLGDIADLFLVHDRPIVRHVDDSIVRILGGRELVIRRARGYAPLPISVRAAPGVSDPVLAVGAHLKNTVALSQGNHVFLSQHIGDLETDEAYCAFRRVSMDLQTLFEAKPSIIAADSHPDYLSTKYADQIASQEMPGERPARPELMLVQHHFAHVLSCMAENDIEPPLLGVAWDGTGYGLDGTVWGGEFFLVNAAGGSRAAHLRRFRLPGGDKAVKQPRRSALGVLFELLGEEAFASAELIPALRFSPAELSTLRTMLVRTINSPFTSSAGRLFDAVASLVNLRQEVHCEGQAAMELEFALEGIQTDEAYSMLLIPADPRTANSPRTGTSLPCVLDWAHTIRAMLEDCKTGVSPGVISARFHNGLVEGILSVARFFGEAKVVLSGGCFQNRYLAERTIERLREEGFQPYWHQRIPPNDGGIALGQVIAARHKLSLSPPLPVGE
jgi:hydrogenase maturation protein HypF